MIDHGLHERVAEALGWSLQAVQSVPLQGLRDLVRPVSDKLARELSQEIGSDRRVVGKPRLTGKNGRGRYSEK